MLQELTSGQMFRFLDVSFFRMTGHEPPNLMLVSAMFRNDSSDTLSRSIGLVHPLGEVVACM
jgi:hypothetical protein